MDAFQHWLFKFTMCFVDTVKQECWHHLFSKAVFTCPSQPKIFPLPPITSNLSTHACSIKCR
jgi:hypothetical protein